MTPTLTYNLHSWGSASAPPALLLHGFTGHGGSWAEAGQTFAAAGFRVLAPDLLGHGRSPAPPDPKRYAMAHAAADLAALLDAAADGPVHLLGYSMGGRLALYFSLTYPERVRSLTLESASPGLASEAERAERRGWDNALADHIERDGIAAFVDYWESLPLWNSQQRRLSTQQRRQLHAQRRQNRPVGLANSLRGIGAGAQPNLLPRLPSLTAPILLLAGADDRKFAAINRQMAEQIPNARLVILPDAGHTVHLERPLAFARAVLTFWSAGDSSSQRSHKRQIAAGESNESRG